MSVTSSYRIAAQVIVSTSAPLLPLRPRVLDALVDAVAQAHNAIPMTARNRAPSGLSLRSFKVYPHLI
jgi:hypothetical protein